MNSGLPLEVDAVGSIKTGDSCHGSKQVIRSYARLYMLARVQMVYSIQGPSVVNLCRRFSGATIRIQDWRMQDAVCSPVCQVWSVLTRTVLSQSL